MDAECADYPDGAAGVNGPKLYHPVPSPQLRLTEPAMKQLPAENTRQFTECHFAYPVPAPDPSKKFRDTGKSSGTTAD